MYVIKLKASKHIGIIILDENSYSYVVIIELKFLSPHKECPLINPGYINAHSYFKTWSE